MSIKNTIYTEKKVRRELKGMIKAAIDDPEVCFINTLVRDKDYTTDVISRWRKKFKHCKPVTQLIKKLFELLEERVVLGAFNKKHHPIFSIFFLKNHFKYADTNKLDLTSKGKRVGYVALPMLKSEKKLSDAKAKRIGRDSK